MNRRLILIPTVIFIPLLIIILYLLVTINQLSNLYDDITANVNIANKYATECKEIIDNNAYLAVTQKKGFSQLERQKRKIDAKIINPYSYLDNLEKACVSTIESGKMTKDLALITSIENPTVLNSEGFIKAIREELEASL